MIDSKTRELLLKSLQGPQGVDITKATYELGINMNSSLGGSHELSDNMLKLIEYVRKAKLAKLKKE